MIPASRRPLDRSLGLNLIASRVTKIGTDAFAIAATPESMCFSPQAISVNGIAPLIRPIVSPSRHAPPISPSAGRAPSCHARNPSRSRPAISIRKLISVVGSKSRTPTLMKRYDAPQIAARAPISTGYERAIT